MKQKRVYEITYGTNKLVSITSKKYVLSHSIGHVLKVMQYNDNKIIITKIEELPFEVEDLTEEDDDS